ncbi:MAG: nitronate monooxygenase [Porticoccaceae bacterium]|nr:nitronate monooxygenase [Porticoccaceae bacterium]
MNIKGFLDIELPIVQAPMAGVQDHKLALAVSLAGGLGSLPCAMLSADDLNSELATIKLQMGKAGQMGQIDSPINFNFFCHTPPVADVGRESRWRVLLKPYFDEYGINAKDILASPGRAPFSHEVADIIEAYSPRVVSFHFGLPSRDLLDRVKAWGSTLLASATTIQEALWLEEQGVDGIIAQGFEAGGHRGMFLSEDLSTQVGTFALLPQIVGRVKVPVIAAGGIADAQGVSAALSLGAIAVQAGTAYLLCSETKTSQIHRAALKSANAQHTALTNLFSGRPARGIVNRVIRELGPMNPATPEFPLAGTAISALRKQAEGSGSGDFTPLWCGQNTSGCREVSASELTKGLAAGL